MPFPPRVRAFWGRGFAAALVATLALSPATTRLQAQETLVLDDEPVLSGDQDPAAGGLKTIAMVGLSGYNPLMEDIGYLGGLAGRPEGAQMIEGLIAMFTQGKGLQGVDKTRPWGVVVQTDGAQFLPLICLPIDDLDQVLKIGEAFGVMSADAGGGVTELTVPNSEMPLFAKKIGAWVYVSQTAESLDTAPADPTTLLKDLVSDYDIGVRVLAQNVPAMFRQMAIAGLQQGLEEGLEQEPDETEEEYEARTRGAKLQMQQVVSFIEETDEVTLGIAINESGKPGLVVDFTLTGLEGSKLLDQFAMYQPAPTNFAGFAKEGAAMSMIQSTKTPAENIDAIVQQTMPQLDAARAQVELWVDEEADLKSDDARETVKSAIASAWESLEATIKTGRTDTAGHLTLESGAIELVLGGTIAKPEKIEEALRKLESVAQQEPDFPAVEWDAAEHNGIKFHKLVIPVKDPQASQIVGEAVEVAVGIGGEAMCIGAGPNAIEALTTALDASAADQGKTVPPFEMVISGKSIAAFAGEVAPPGNPTVGLIAGMFDDISDEESRIVFTLAPLKNGARYRMTAAEGVLQAIGVMANMAAQQAGAAGGGEF